MKGQNSETNCREPSMDYNEDTIRLQCTSFPSNSENSAKHTMAILKAALPYVDVHSMRSVQAMVKATELIDTINSQAYELTTLNINDGKGDMEGLLNSVKEFCSDRERDLIDTILNFINAKNLYSTYSTLFTMGKDQNTDGNPYASAFGFDDNANMMDILSAMLTPEQQSTFETLNMIFSTMQT